MSQTAGSPTGEPEKRDLWAEALLALDKDHQDLFNDDLLRKQEHHQLLKDILSATNEKKEECLRKRWKLTRGDRQIIVRDILEKISTWINTFISIGDVMAQYDPGNASAPWAAVRFCLQVTVNDMQVYCAVLESIELVTRVLARCVIMEHLYLQGELEVKDEFYKALIALYTAILEVLAKAMRFYSKSTAMRLAKSIVTGPKDIESWTQSILKNQAEVERLAGIADAEKLNTILENVDLVQKEQSMSRKRDEELLRLLQTFQQPINRMDKQLSDLHDNLEKQLKIKILKAISTIPSQAHHKAASKDRLKGSGKWLLEKEIFQDWRSESASSVLWLHGIPGSGKTKLASLVIDELRGNAHVAYFYCMRNPAEPERAECDKILSSLVRQLACLSPNGPILKPVLQKYQDAIEGFEEFEDQTWTSDDSTEILIELIDMYPSMSIVIDALDEVNQYERVELLDKLTHILNESQSLVKIFISSRDNIDIVMRLQGSPNLHIGAQENSEDIKNFVNERLSKARLLYGNLSPPLQEKISQTLIDGAQGMFRWVDLQIQSLRTLKVAADIKARLGHLPETLEGSYWEIYSQIEQSGENAAKLARTTFQWLLCARAPIKIEDFAILASAESSNRPGSEMFTVSQVRDVCLNLVISNELSSSPDTSPFGSQPRTGDILNSSITGDTSPFGFAHLSVREFLEGLSKRGIAHFNLVNANAAIASLCLSYLTITLTPSTIKTDMTEAMKHASKYSVNHWPYHVVQSDDLKKQPPLDSQIMNFLVQDQQVAPTFIRWCTELESSNPSEELTKAVGGAPYNPIWLAFHMNVIEVNKITISDEEMRRSAFLYAAEIGYVEVLTTLLNQGVDIRRHGKDALLATARNGRLDAMKFLLRKGAIAPPDTLYYAILRQDHPMIEALFKDAKEQFSSHHLSKALTAAVSDGNTEIATILSNMGTEKEAVAVVRALKASTINAAISLIEFGYDVTGQYLLEKRTALHWAAEKGYNQIVKMLLLKEVPVNARDYEWDTPLHLAATKGHTAIFLMLLICNADIESKNIMGRTAAHYAMLANRPSIVEMLKTHEANFLAKDREGYTPLDLAKRYDRTAILQILEPGQPAGDSPTLKTEGSSDHVTLELGSDSFRKNTGLLIAKRASPGQETAAGETPLDKEQAMEIFNCIIDSPVEENAISEVGHDPTGTQETLKHISDSVAQEIKRVRETPLFEPTSLVGGLE